MVFENLTLFEIRLEDAQFGPRSLGRNDADHPDDSIDAESGNRGRFAALFVLMGLTAAMAVLWRRSRGGDADLTIEEDAEADLATAE